MASADLVWEIVRNQNSYLVKRKNGGGVQFSRDPLNLTNKHSRKYAGFVNDKAIGVVPNEKGGVKIISKKAADVQKPAKCTTETQYRGGKTSRSTYKAVANQTAKNGYRPDLRAAAVSRASALLQSQREKKPVPEKKTRGKKAAAAAESS
ncbi:ribosomal L28e/Mak16 [Microdochium bolleyi]|uniref:Ribosomal L28e/Mak16 n=1 Tax=Microdochium bolleyi TaxID=196109 RepID=A0A136JK63_9PEZI|nr:ribosomal L28e/Mak16 [Microdochium bolleyi]